MAEKEKLLAVFPYLDDVVRALGRLREQKASVETVYSPAPNEQLERAVGMKPSPVRRFVLFGGIFGATFGFTLASFAATRWGLIVWGRHPIAPIPYVVPAFELCILFGVLSGIAGLLILSRMPRLKIPRHFDARFTVDRYGVLIACPRGQRERFAGLLKEAGAEEVRDVGV